MSILKAEYRLTVFAPRSTDPTEVTVLTPVAGAAHSDPFQCTTEFGGAVGWKPYLSTPRGRFGRLDVLLHKTSIAEFSVDVQDTIIASTNTVRWVTAFMGNTKGRNRYKGLKAKLQQRMTTDGVAGAWADYFIGRIDRTEKANPSATGPVTRFYIVGDRKDETRNVFVGPPHSSVTYAYPCVLLPIGLQDRGDGLGWGGNPATARATGSIEQYTVTGRTGLVSVRVKVNQSLGNLLKITTALASSVDQRDIHPQSTAFPQDITPNLRCRLKRLDTNAEGDFWLTSVPHPSGNKGYDGHSLSALYHDGDGRVTSFGLIPITQPNFPSASYPANAHPYKYMDVPPGGTAVSFYLYRAGVPTDDAPLMIDNVDPLTLWKDLLDAKFSDLQYGEIQFRPIRYNSAAFTALAGKFPIARGLVHETENLNNWLERSILRATHAVGRVNGSGEIEPADVRIPTDPTALATTITNVDYIQSAREGPVWRAGQDTLTGVMLTQKRTDYYEEALHNAVRVGDVPLDFPPHGLVVKQDPPLLYVSDLFADVPPRVEIVDVAFIPSMVGAYEFMYAAPAAAQASREYLSFFGGGASVLDLPCRRTANTDKRPGDYVKVTVTAQPNPASNVLGGTRVMLVADRYERDDGSRFLELLDAGPDTVGVAPTAGALTLNALDPKHAVDQAFTVNANFEPVEIWVAITSTAIAVRPVEASLDWMLVHVATLSGSYTIPSLQANVRAWTRLRTKAVGKLPSVYVFPAGSSIDTTPLTAPSALVATVSNRSIVLTWTNGEGSAGTMPTLNGVDVLAKPLKPGTTRYVFDELAASTLFTVGVRHVDTYGGSSTITSTTATTGTAATLPAPRNLMITQARGAAGPVSLPPERMIIRAGLKIRWLPTALYARTRVQLSTSSTFAGTPELDEYFEEGVSVAILETVLDSTLRHIRCRHERTGSTESAWSATVSAYPTALVEGDGADGFPGGTAELSIELDGTIKLSVDHGGDPDVDRVYYEAVRNSATFPVVDETDSFIDRASMPYFATLSVGGSTNIGADEIKLTASFWNAITGFGQRVTHSMKADVEPPRLQIHAVLSTNKDTADVSILVFSRAGEGVRVHYHDDESTSTPVIWSLVTGNGSTTVLFASSNTIVDASNWFYNGAGAWAQKLNDIVLTRDQIERIFLQGEGQTSGSKTSWIPFAIDVKGQPWLESVALEWDDIADTLKCTVKAGARVLSVRTEFDDDNGFGSVNNTTNANMNDGDTATHTYALSAAQRDKVWYVRVTPYNLTGQTGLAGVAQVAQCYVTGNVSKKIRVPGLAFTPHNVPSTDFTKTDYGLSVGVDRVAQVFFAGVPLPAGSSVVLTGFRIRAGAGDIGGGGFEDSSVSVDLIRNNDGGTATVLGTAAVGDDGLEQVTSTTSLSESTASNTYALKATLFRDTGTIAYLMWVELDYTMPDQQASV